MEGCFFRLLLRVRSYKYICIILFCMGLVFYVTVRKGKLVNAKGKSVITSAPEQMTTRGSELPLKLLSEEEYKSLFQFDGIWLGPKNSCECVKTTRMTVYQMKDHIAKDQIASVTERREKEFKEYRRRYPTMTKDAIIAAPNTPLSYPIYGAEVMPLHTIVIPGLGFHGKSPGKVQVILRASFGTLNTLADTSKDVVNGRGGKELTISTSNAKLLNHILKHITYTSAVFLVNAVDMVSFETGSYLVKFPVTIRQLALPKLFDPGPGNNIRDLVTITIKTFMRYHKLRILIKSIRQFYPDIKLIVADDSEHPEKIEEASVEHYIMPYGKGWFAGRNLAISQVTTKYYLWVDDDYLFTKNTKIEKLVEVLENTNLDVIGGHVTGNDFKFKIFYEEGEDGSCLHIRRGSYHPLEGFPKCVVTGGVVNFFLARTEESRRVAFDPKLQRVAHLEYFVDGLGDLLVGSCSDVGIGHQSHQRSSDSQLAAIEKNYNKFRAFTQEKIRLKLSLYYFKNRLKCYTMTQ
ncbi:beta-1,4 N-acetylgalactosaminyltransferase 2-like isoform X1 [Heteronotia binoei]|uniref:beta-1,4 N-acetylgalactosaminyltransferase 2-like isoform X1 n=1 Tax=Heteronotia binoei TaxID=13085 RepID=UPI0029309372|nr:beta-1,4 N-acetylgalactosaminyltransferase 2-like isoform X1 [Heteronotia binoei]